ncbi:MAG TPA: amidohydrolase family protein [Clostridiales bacterium]|nr:amidohydrolase family protein [Clostridiales bacterium]
MFLDIHAHVYRYPYPTPDGRFLMASPDQLLERMDELAIDRAVLLPLVSPELYVPQSVGEIIELAQASEGRFIPFCNIDPRVLTNSSDAPLGILLEHYKKLGCKGVGEVLPNMPWSEPRLQNLLRCTEQAGLPLVFDITGRINSGYGIYDDPGLPQLEQCLQKYPNLVMVGHGPAFWAEISVLRKVEDRLTYPSYPIDKEGRVVELLRTYPNLWVEISAGSGANALLRDMEYAPKFLQEFSDRILFGTDICYADQDLPQGCILKTLLDAGKISQDVFLDIAYRNGERLLSLAPLENRRAF